MLALFGLAAAPLWAALRSLPPSPTIFFSWRSVDASTSLFWGGRGAVPCWGGWWPSSQGCPSGSWGLWGPAKGASVWTSQGPAALARKSWPGGARSPAGGPGHHSFLQEEVLPVQGGAHEVDCSFCAGALSRCSANRGQVPSQQIHHGTARRGMFRWAISGTHLESDRSQATGPPLPLHLGVSGTMGSLLCGAPGRFPLPHQSPIHD